MTMPANAGAPVEDKPEEVSASTETVANPEAEKDYEAGLAAPPPSHPAAEGQAEQVESVDTPAETAPPEPAPEAASEPAVVPDSPELVQLRQQNALYQQQATAQQQAQSQQFAAQQLQQLVDQRVAQDISELTPIWGEDIAKQYGERTKELHRQSGQTEQRHQQAMTEFQSKVQIAMKLSERDGSSMTELMQLSTPQAMVSASEQSRVIRGLQEEAAKVKRATVPAQTVSDGQTGAKSASRESQIVAKFTEVGMDGLTDSEKAVIEKKFS